MFLLGTPFALVLSPMIKLAVVGFLKKSMATPKISENPSFNALASAPPVSAAVFEITAWAYSCPTISMVACAKLFPLIIGK